jgi:molybdenum cofactor biosynthesis protein B
VSETSKKHKASAPKHLKFAVYVCSTSRYQELQRGEKITDVSGDTIEALLKSGGHTVLSRKIIADDQSLIAEAVKNVLNSAELDAVIFCGGTGIGPKDVTIETVQPFLEKILPGFGEIFRRLSYDKVGSAAVMSRAVAGVAKGKALFCIPGSPDAVRVSVEMLILPEAPHIVRHIRE